MIQLYTTNNCPYCDAVKIILKENKVDFKEYNVAADEVRREEMIKLTGMRKVPVLRNGDAFTVGADESEVMRIVNK